MDEWKCNQCGARYSGIVPDIIPEHCEDEECNEGTLILIQDSEWPQIQLQGSPNPPLPLVALSPETPLTDPKTPDSIKVAGLNVGEVILGGGKPISVGNLLDAMGTPKTGDVSTDELLYAERGCEMVDTYTYSFVPPAPDPQLTPEQSHTLDRTADNFCMICSPEWVSGIPHIPNDPLTFAHAPNCVAHLLCDSCKDAILEQWGNLAQHESFYADPDPESHKPMWRPYRILSNSDSDADSIDPIPTIDIEAMYEKAMKYLHQRKNVDPILESIFDAAPPQKGSDD